MVKVNSRWGSHVTIVINPEDEGMGGRWIGRRTDGGEDEMTGINRITANCGPSQTRRGRKSKGFFLSLFFFFLWMGMGEGDVGGADSAPLTLTPTLHPNHALPSDRTLLPKTLDFPSPVVL